MFSRHAKDPVKTWRDFYFDLQTYFDGWLKESKVTTLEELKNLIVANQIKKKAPQDYKDHFWTNDVIGIILYNLWTSWIRMKNQSRRETGILSNSRRNPVSKDRIPEKKIVDTKEDRTPVSCYGCGAPGIIRSRCHTCNPYNQISNCNTEAAVCADTGATHSVAGEKLYHLLKQKGLNFEEKTMQMTLADGRTQTTEILTTSVDISIQGKVIPTELLILKNARGNRTLLGIDFLTAAGIVLDLQRKQWYFTETSHRKYNFVKAPPNINALLTVDPEPHLCQLRKNEDASNYALGAVLLQGEGSDEHPIEYASRLLTPAERNYSTTERPLLWYGL
ncbi:retrovirus-related Pol polyprotein from transposon opus [Trichonephila clavipes]|nr:retrovirus-related Pol polyprotein from transposon opus [Trichonephila clavipes]